MAAKSRVDRLAALALGDLICLPMVLRAAINLKVFEIIAEAGDDAHLSSALIAAKIPTTNPNAFVTLERLLRVLVAHSFLTVRSQEEEGRGKAVAAYGLANKAACLVPGEDGTSMAALVLMTMDEATVRSFYHLEDAVREEGFVPFEAANGLSLFEFASKAASYNMRFQEVMSSVANITMNEVFQVYNGFNDVKQLVDVGGGIGTCISMVVSKYPHIHGVNFDLPHVIAIAPKYSGVEHVGGSMFDSVPNAEAIFMKGILHDWDDDKCLQILRNCWKALPDGGKVINLETVMPSQLGIDSVSQRVTSMDMFMLAFCSNGKERNLEELKDLANAAGFIKADAIPIGHGLHIIEFHKGDAAWSFCREDYQT